jgi:hypothetical protein
LPDTETLFGMSAVYLFGRRLEDLVINRNAYAGMQKLGKNNFLFNQLNDQDGVFARIFAFSFEGELFDLERPAIFLVHGLGIDPDEPAPTNADYRRLARSPGSSSKSGLGLQSTSFAEGTRAWLYDKADVSMRMEVETGSFEQILLSCGVRLDGSGILDSGSARSSGGLARSSGGLARSSGGLARSSGGMARSSGWKPGE